jgi:hypothetical protein
MKDQLFPNESAIVRHVAFCGVLTAAIISSGCSSCSASGLEGTYRNANGMATLELRSGGNAALSAMGENHVCTYKKDDTKLLLTCPNQDVMTITIHDDGSLTADGTFIGAMTKAK